MAQISIKKRVYLYLANSFFLAKNKPRNKEQIRHFGGLFTDVMRGFFAALVLYVICSAFHFEFSEISLLLLWFVIKQQQQHAECVLKLRLTVWVALAFRSFRWSYWGFTGMGELDLAFIE